MKLREEDIAKRYLEFLEKNNRKPRACFCKNGKKLSLKDLEPEQKREINLYLKAQKYQLLTFMPKDASEEYKDTIKKIRELLREITIKKDLEQAQEYLKFIEENGREPSGAFAQKGKTIKSKYLTESQKAEKLLYNRWRNCNINLIYQQNLYESIEKVPEEYREIVAKVREVYKELERKKYDSVIDEYIEYVKKNKRYPRSCSYDNHKQLTMEEMTEEQRKEVRLYQKLYSTGLREIIILCEGKTLDEIPNQYKHIASKIIELNALMNPKGELQLAYDYVDFVKKNKRRPKRAFYENRKVVSRSVLTDEQREEIKFKEKLDKSGIWKKLLEYKEEEEEKIPEEYKEIVRMLKSADLIVDANSRGILKYIEFIEKNGRLPRGNFSDNNKESKAYNLNLTDEQKEERNIYTTWVNSSVHYLLLKYNGQDISNVPEEYRETIGKIRKLYAEIDKKTELDLMNKYISFIEKNGRKPRKDFYETGTRIIKQNLTDEEIAELNLYRKTFKKGIAKKIERLNVENLDDIPEEYREAISKLRKIKLVGDGKLHNKLESIKELREAKSERDNAQEINLKAKELENEVREKTEQEVNKEKE